MLSKLFAISALSGLLAVLPANAAQIAVTVGGAGGIIAYNPPSVIAKPGDTVVFIFKQKNHTVTASTFEQPCTPLPGGFDSNFVPVPDNNTSGPFPQAQFVVQDTNPVWIYCRQTGHCQKGMVFAINPQSDAQLAQFKAAAMSTGAASSIAPSSASPVVSSTAAPATSTGTSSTSQDHKIIVGGTGILAYQPANITAQPGDTVTFEFHAKNHSATQSSFKAPCVPLAETSSQPGFESGFMPVQANATTFPTFVVQVNDTTTPIWVFCRQTGHCGQGMVFAINANETGPNSFEAFVERAKEINGTSSSSNSTGSGSGSKNGAGAVHLGGLHMIAISFAAVLVGLML